MVFVIFRMASRLLVAALSVPLPLPQTESDKYLMFDETARDKSRRLATLLGIQGVPTRAGLVNDLVSSIVSWCLWNPKKNLLCFCSVNFFCRCKLYVVSLFFDLDEAQCYGVCHARDQEFVPVARSRFSPFEIVQKCSGHYRILVWEWRVENLCESTAGYSCR